ncbi:Alpha/Beta hydrolase protein [Podospora didyma]|uniref:Carboxylic ester hydrolase n=1 Tax=Podospora didyma TaxID=330526 RepID=A0AAE0U4F7_9PEZI|nr:Alpha/Beta hydrolase protein [Podospora didyma]
MTPGGLVHGFINPATPHVREFLGIPYAQPPIGPLRFAPPRPALPFGAMGADELPSSCPQFLSEIPPSVYTENVNEFNLEGLNITSLDVSEDCLTLSVWTPSQQGLATQHRLLPVFIFIFGGAFLTGGTDVPYQIPTRWVERTQSHLVVTFNYRLNFFGFPHAAGLPDDQQNLGLFDQRMAIEWVRDNIAAFGGDPKHMTLWGQSAGAISVGFYQFAYPDDPIVSGVIMDSGSELLPGTTLSTADTSHTTFSEMASHFGCGKMSPADELTCMRGTNISGLDIQGFIQSHNTAQVAAFLKGEPSTYMFFTPVIDNRTIFSDYEARAKEGKMAKIPTILGSNSEDGVPFVLLDKDGKGVNKTMAFAVTLGWFFCPAFKAATNRLDAGVPVWRYEYEGNFSNISPLPFMGAYHSSELPLIFGTDQDYRGNSTELELATSRALQDAWLSFASTGDPEHGWPRYTDPVNGLVRKFARLSDDYTEGNPVEDASMVGKEKLCQPIYQPSA